MNLDVAALRAFMTAVDLGGFGKAADQLHRTPGAISLQMKALEARIGHSVFARTGRHQALTPTGEVLLSHARRIVNANDEAVLALIGMAVSGEVRVGMPQDAADAWLTPALGPFARAFPSVRVHVRIARSLELKRALDSGELDIAMLFGTTDDSRAALTKQFNVNWWGAENWAPADNAPLSLLLLDNPCTFRDAAISALDEVKREWRLGMASGSLSAVWAGVKAGLGVTARTAISVPQGVVILNGKKLPKLGAIFVSVHISGHTLTEPTARLRDLICAEVHRYSVLTA